MSAARVVQRRDHNPGRHADGLADYLGHNQDGQYDPSPVDALWEGRDCRGRGGGDRHGSGSV